MSEEINLVDRAGRRIGAIGKMEAHMEGVLHEAFSIFIFNDRGELLLQQRAAGKYHSAGLWSNSCCSHPRVGEELADAARRRLSEELGLCADGLHEAFSFIYRVSLEGGLVEHEFDHVFIGCVPADAALAVDPAEASAVRWTTLRLLDRDVRLRPEAYSFWLKDILSDGRFAQAAASIGVV